LLPACRSLFLIRLALMIRSCGRTATPVRLFTAGATTGPTDITPSPRPPRSSAPGSFTLDGEAVVSDAVGIAVFGALHRRHRATDAMLYAFDLLELDSKDLRPLPLSERKAKLARLLARAPTGIVYNEHTDQDGAVVFRHACQARARGHRVEAGQRALPVRALPGIGSRSRIRTAR